jgi:hypothetical protein
MLRQRRQVMPFDKRLAAEATRLREKAQSMPFGIERDDVLRKAREADTAAHINQWLTSPGLASPP